MEEKKQKKPKRVEINLRIFVLKKLIYQKEREIYDKMLQENYLSLLQMFNSGDNDCLIEEIIEFDEENKEIGKTQQPKKRKLESPT